MYLASVSAGYLPEKGSAFDYPAFDLAAFDLASEGIGSLPTPSKSTESLVRGWAAGDVWRVN